ncbi:MAG: hypothetical protein AAF674_17655 [Pseudomonadota bacterium]
MTRWITQSLLALLVAAPLLGMGPPAQAQNYRSQTMVQEGSWLLEMTYNTQRRSSWCVAKGENTQGQVLSFAISYQGGTWISVYDASWSWDERAERLTVSVDGNDWSVDARAKGPGIGFRAPSPQVRRDFTRHLSGGSTATLSAPGMGQIGVFDLAGARTALSQLEKCQLIIAQAASNGQPPF